LTVTARCGGTIVAVTFVGIITSGSFRLTATAAIVGIVGIGRN